MIKSLPESKKTVKVMRMFNSDIKIFENMPVVAGFTTRECQGKDRREALAAAAASRGGAAVRLGLVHGSRIAAINPSDLLRAQNGMLDCEDTDGAVTGTPGVILTTGHADCLPIYLYDPVKKAIGLAHAGWKGILTNIAQALVQSITENFASDPGDMKALIGPGIGLCCFQVGTDVKEAFCSAYPWAEEFTVKETNEKFRLDLKGISKRQLELSGMSDIEISPHCTKCREDLFFSYRRNQESGRMLAYIYLKGENE